MKNTRVSKAIAVVFVSILLVCSAFAQRGGQNIALLLDTNRDFTGNITATDRTWFYLNQNGTPKPAGDGIYPSIEVSDDGIPSNDIDKAFYVRGSSITLVVTLKTYTNSPDAVSGTLSLSDAKFVTSGTEYACSISGPATVSVPGSGGTQNITLTFTGLPNFVAKGQLKFKSFVTLTAPSNGQPTGHIAWGTSASSVLWPSTIYLTDQTPTGHQTVPWTDLLDYSCLWAHGQTGEVLCSKKVTLGLYWSQQIAYNIGTENIDSEYVDYDVDGKFKLKNLLDDFSQVGASPANCVDISYAVMLACQGLGVNASCKRIREIENRDFLTNPICPIGSDATNTSNYRHVSFSMHQQTRVLSNVFDGALALVYDLSGANYKNPPANWDVFQYWQKWGISGHPVLGLTYRLYSATDSALPVWGYSPDQNIGPSIVNNYGFDVDLNGVK
ncbi:hypothetical protein CCB80_03020 [Armatimonadetes bacterium Uphvl-Ar1]|nr:hypothetical protein CCB80_03020 [Armatimonadetes bacterium Uphvl-Ar1]